MKNNQQTLKSGDARAEIFLFDNGTEVREVHAMIHVDKPGLPFSNQVQTISECSASLFEKELQGFVPVFKRYYLSDSANQVETLRKELETEDCACSVIEQTPLDGTKIALWIYGMTNIRKERTESGLYSVKHGKFNHLWGGSFYNELENSEAQTTELFHSYIGKLQKENCSLADNCIRTWFFVRDVDRNYAGVVRARNNVFATQGLTSQTHYISSTGIGGRQASGKVLVQMDAYAVENIAQRQIHYLYAPTHLNRTSEYGVSFERGTYVDYGDRRQVFISGTASIDNKGAVVYQGDIVRQTQHMWENVEKLLEEAECGWDDVSEMSVYLRDVADASVVHRMFAEKFPNKPYVIVYAPVCRPGWLIEMECMAVKTIKTGFENF